MSVIDKINGFIGVDWSLNKIIVDDGEITIHLLEERGYQVTISCCNFTGFSFIGHWEEGIIEKIWVESTGDLITDSLQEIKRLYGKPPFPSCIRQMKEQYYQLNIKMIDGSVIKVACESFEFI